MERFIAESVSKLKPRWAWFRRFWPVMATICLGVAISVLVTHMWLNEASTSGKTNVSPHLASEPCLTFTELVTPETIQAGEPLTLTLVVRNSSALTATNVTVTDTLFPHTTFAWAQPQPTWVRDEAWAERSPMPTARRGLAVVAWAGRIYAVGGCDGITVTNVVEVHDPTSDAWTATAPMPIAKRKLGAATVNDRIYAIGGHDGVNVLNAVEVYDSLTNTWTSVNSMPEPRYGMAVAALGDESYVIAGRDGQGNPTSTVFVHGPISDTWKTGPELPWGRELSGLAATALCGKIYALGGSAEGLLNVYDSTKDNPWERWKWKRSMITPRRELGAAVVGDHIYAIGGRPGREDDLTPLDTSEAYHPGTDQWIRRLAMPTARYDAGVAAVDGRIYVVGGTDGSGVLSTTEVYTPPTLIWSLGRLAPGQEVTLTLGLTTDSSLAQGSIVINSALVGSGEGACASAYAKARVGTYDCEVTIARRPAAQARPSIAAWGDTIYAVWEEDGHLAFSRSPDCGETWITPTLIFTGTQPKLGVAPGGDYRGGVHLVWRDQEVLSHTLSLDGGVGFLPPSTITEQGGSPWAGNPDLALDDNGNLYSVWLSDAQRLNFAKSTDHGSSWITREVTSEFCGGWAAPAKVAVSHSGQNVYVAWQSPDLPCGTPIRVQFVRSTDGGESWQSRSWQVGAGNYAPDIAAHGEGDVYIVFDHDSSYWHSIELLKSDDGGATFPIITTVSDEAVRLYPWRSLSSPSIDLGEEGDIYVAWDTRRYGDYDVHFDVSTDGGQTFGRDQPLTVNSSDQRYPSIVARSERHCPWSYVGWYDAARNGKICGQPVSTYPISIRPDQMTLTGDVTTSANCVDDTVCSWLDDTPAGTIMLGVDPTSSIAGAWDGGTATVEIYLPNIYTRTLVVLELSWPDRDGKGLHSPERNRAGAVTLDGRQLWDKRTTELSAFNDYYAAEHNPILTTIVLTQSITHTLSFSVSAHTAWDLSQIELTAYPYPTATRGIGYSPFRDCQYPGGERQPSVQDLREDLFRLFHTTNAVRTYAAASIESQIPALANALGLPVYAGAWIDHPETTLAQDNAEIQALIDLACTADLEAVIVGNEYYHRHHRTGDAANYLQQRIREVKSGIQSRCGKDVPVTTAEIDTHMFGWEGNPPIVITGTQPVYRPILDEVDFVMVHTYPFWDGMPIDGAAAFTVNRYRAIQALLEQTYPGQNKWVIIGETGWPSGGGSNGKAVPGPRNQRKYMLELLPLAEQAGVDLLYFDAFDELWKIEEPGRVGQHWGYSYTDRSAKHSFYGVLLPAEQLPPSPSHFSDTVYLPQIAKPSTEARRFPVYTEWPEGPGHFVPSGWMGDTESIELFECDRCDPHTGEMAIRVSFSPYGHLGSGGVYWQYPENNWGNLEDGIDLSWANKLTFWAKGREGGERIRFFAGGIGTKNDPHPDSLRPEVSTGFIQLTDLWQQYIINLRGQDLSHVVGGFGWATDKCANPSEVTFYLDDIVYEYDPDLAPPPPPGPIFAVYTDAAEQGNHYFPTAWMGDGQVAGRVSLTECWGQNPRSGRTSIRIDYSQQVLGWAGLYWVSPPGNWGDRPGGHNLTGADRLTFWARSDTPTVPITFIIGGIGYPVDYQGNADCLNPSEPYPDSVCPKIQQSETLSSIWTKYTIPLPQSRDLRRVVGGFGWVSENPVTFYLDDIVYEFD